MMYENLKKLAILTPLTGGAMSELYHFSYISKLHPDYDATCISDIVKASRENNNRDHLTGVLVFDGERFFQYAEGEQSKLLDLLKRLKNDARHIDMSVLFLNAHTSSRLYKSWHLAYSYADDTDFFESLKSLSFEQIISRIKSVDSALDFEP
jgi:hypothetical protein